MVKLPPQQSASIMQNVRASFRKTCYYSKYITKLVECLSNLPLYDYIGVSNSFLDISLDYRDLRSKNKAGKILPISFSP